ncbi:hypothetical protein F5884DRAFT_335443 [Xylogone sp. PMI_703]|nr:hypothetical protein F5884DRAFT_335443 [Xylogone sp. PMI_703]
MSSYYGHSSSRSRAKPKPLLRKLAKSERNSLDLDRAVEEQNGLGIWEDYGAGPRSSYDTYRELTRRGYHARSTSGTSQFSSTTSGGSLPRTGSFVHPFQQTPRPHTPPLADSYPASLRESVHSKDSPAITEDGDAARHTYRSVSNLSNTSPLITQTTTATSTMSQPLRMQSTRSNSRLAVATTQQDLEPSPIISQDTVNSTTDSMSPISIVRNSMDINFRLRSRSEVDERLRAETIQEARRKFFEKEARKEEKAARQEIKAREKREEKEAKEIERRHRRSSASDVTRSRRSRSDPAMMEKGELLGRDYNTVRVQTPPRTAPETQAETMEPPRRSFTVSRTKKKTHSTWTRFMIWLRTRFIRLGRKIGTS